MNIGTTTNSEKDDLAIIAAILFIVFVNLCAWSMLADGDTSWHVAAGDWILSHRSVPLTDPFSFTFAGKSWVAHEWLSEAIMALAWRAAGWSGLSLLFAVAGAGLFLIQALNMRRSLPAIAIFIALFAQFLVLQPFLLARPHMLAWPILAGWTVALADARRDHRAPPLITATLMLVWANVHGSFSIGLLLVGPFALEALIEEQDRRGAFMGWAKFGIAALLASCLTPNGPAGLLFPFQVSAMESLPMIREWQPTNFGQLSAFPILLLVGLFLALWRGIKVPPVRLLLLLLLLTLAILHIRHQAIFVIVATILLAEPAARAIGATDMLKPPIRTAIAGYRKQAIAFGMLLLLIGGVRLFVPMHRTNGVSVPVAALDALPPDLRNVPVFNNYDFGGALILAGVRPFIDGRADLYGDSFMRDYSRIAGGDMDRFRAIVARWRIGWAILSPTDALVQPLQKDPSWSTIHTDPYAVILVRRPEPLPSSTKQAR